MTLFFYAIFVIFSNLIITLLCIMLNTANLTTEQINYVHEKVLFFSVEFNEEYVHFYRDGTINITNPDDKLLADLHNQFKHDDFIQAFYSLKSRTDKLKKTFKGLNFYHDVIILDEIDND